MIKEKDKEALKKFGEGMRGRGGERGQSRGERGGEEDEIIKSVSREPLTPSNLVIWAERLGKILVDRGLKSAKLRRIYDPVTVLKARLRAIVSKGEKEQEKELENIRASLLFLKRIST